MVQFNELRITPDDAYLIIDVSILDVAAYDDVYLKDIYIDNQDTFVNDSTPSTKAVKVYDAPTQTTKNGRVTLSASQLETLGLSIGDLLFVYVETQGTPAIDTPCGGDNCTTLGVVYDQHKLYIQSINYLKEVNCDCKLPKHLIDWIIRLKAFELSIKTGNFSLTIKYWNKFFSNTEVTSSSTNPCKCYD